MASISPPTFPPPSTCSSANPHRPCLRNPNLISRQPPPSLTRSSLSAFHSHSRVSDSTLCSCLNGHSDFQSSSDDSSIHKKWEFSFQEVVRNAIKRFDDFVNSHQRSSNDITIVDSGERPNDVKDEDWDWDRWRMHFDEVDEQERIVSVLKSQLSHAINREDYEDAARLKVAIAAAATSDTVGGVISRLNSAIKEEHYQDAAFIRDYAGAGLVGWWAGVSENRNDPYGRIIRISAEHGRYVAKSYSPRQLATAAAGVPLFEIFVTTNRKGEYKLKAVYLKRRGVSQDPQTLLSKPGIGPKTETSLDPIKDETDMFTNIEDTEDGDDSNDDAEGLSGFQNILRDMIPGVKVKVLKVIAPEKVDRNMISKVIEQIMEEEEEDEEEKDIELEREEIEDDIQDGIDQEQDEIGEDIGNVKEQTEIAVKVVVGGLVQKLSSSVQTKELLRVPARMEKRGRLSFSFSIEKDDKLKDDGGKRKASLDKPMLRGRRSMDHVMFDLSKFVGREKIPLKVLKEVGDLINLTLSQARNCQPLSGSTTFNRIEIPASPDPLNGLYIGGHGLYTSEVIHLRRKFGQWKEDSGPKEPPKLEFYEYVEALKLTGDPYVPAGQVAFRAKVGKRNQLPHKGIIPEEFGVIARYRGQGRLAEPGFRNPRWVDGELVILDGKYIKGGPVVGFVYWAPEHHFLVFFNRLRLQE